MIFPRFSPFIEEGPCFTICREAIVIAERYQSDYIGAWHDIRVRFCTTEPNPNYLVCAEAIGTSDIAVYIPKDIMPVTNSLASLLVHEIFHAKHRIVNPCFTSVLNKILEEGLAVSHQCNLLNMTQGGPDDYLRQLLDESEENGLAYYRELQPIFDTPIIPPVDRDLFYDASNGIPPGYIVGLHLARDTIRVNPSFLVKSSDLSFREWQRAFTFPMLEQLSMRRCRLF